ncbi:MAG: glycoside hydrolase family 2 TIM barrel-domain containing protein, partial [Bacteroidota bacterium]|nr:glycoside hydrolase family 2 TIM barrel-domain containing protein [Bacteroidota bacterium]
LKIRVEDEGTRLNGGESMKSRGIWDDVSLIALPDVFVEQGMYIKTSFNNKTIECSFPINNTTENTQTVIVKYFITDNNGKVVKTINGGAQTINGKSIKAIHMKATWNNPHLWFPYDPYLYHLNTVLYSKSGKAVDWQRERFGFREITWSGPVLYLNGRELHLRGHGEHYLGDIQASREYFVNWLSELKKLGINYMRLHIYPRHKILYDVADEVGFMLEAEPAFHFQVPKDEEFAKKHLGDMIKGLINHPSIVTWSVSNEQRWSGGGEKKWLVDHAKSIDSTRPVFSSDFSEYSVSGDVLGHHYNTETVFKEWEQFGPNKPMIWDECGEVWQANRPLGNGSAGYEVIAQDYATGLYRDGNDEIKTAMDLIRDGKTFAGKLHRVNAIIPWDLGNVFFRWQPVNRFKGIALSYKTLEGDGVKPIQVLPCSTPVNIWDPTLPVYEPNPGYYIFAEDMKWVRFPYDSKNFSFFGGAKATINSPLLIYEDLRLVDEIRCRIETTDGKLLSQTIKKVSIKPGDMLHNFKWEFIIPATTDAKAINIVREFCYQGKPGYRDVREGKIFPKFTSNQINLYNNKIGIIDPQGKLKSIMESAQIPYKTISKNLTGINILLVVGNNLPENVNQLTETGMRIIQFKDSNEKLQNGSARLLVNGPGFKLLNGIT